MRMRERVCAADACREAAAETHSSLLLLCHCHAARVCLVQQSHNAVVLACGSLFLLRGDRHGRSDANGGRSRAARRWRAWAWLTWIGLRTALASQRRSSSSSRRSSNGTIAQLLFLLALRSASAAWSIRSVVLNGSQAAATKLASRFTGGVHAGSSATDRKRNTYM